MYIDKHIVFKSNLSEHNLGSLWAQSKKDNCQMHKDESRQEDVFFFYCCKGDLRVLLIKNNMYMYFSADNNKPSVGL